MNNMSYYYMIWDYRLRVFRAKISALKTRIQKGWTNLRSRWNVWQQTDWDWSFGHLPDQLQFNVKNDIHGDIQK